MRTLHHPGTQGTAAYGKTLMVAAHLSMRNTPRYDIWITPVVGPDRKLTDSDPLYRAAVKEIESEGGLEIGETGRWESKDGKFVARRA